MHLDARFLVIPDCTMGKRPDRKHVRQVARSADRP
jgi:hypothetical protein